MHRYALALLLCLSPSCPARAQLKAPPPIVPVRDDDMPLEPDTSGRPPQVVVIIVIGAPGAPVTASGAGLTQTSAPAPQAPQPAAQTATTYTYPAAAAGAYVTAPIYPPYAHHAPVYAPVPVYAPAPIYVPAPVTLYTVPVVSGQAPPWRFFRR